MFRNLYQSALNISNFLWEPTGVLLGCACLWFLWKMIREPKRQLPWFVLSGMVFAVVWRICFRITSGRYFGAAVVPALFLIFTMVWILFPWKRIRHVLLCFAFCCCIGHILHHNPYEKSMKQLYAAVKADSCNFTRKTGLSFSTQFLRERYYTGIPVMQVDRESSSEVMWKNLAANLRVWDGDQDVVYLFMTLRSGETVPEWFLSGKYTGQLSRVGESWVDRRKRKRTLVFRYIPAKTRFDTKAEKLFPNGDFSKILNDKGKEETRHRLGKRSVRFLKQDCIFPQGWGLYQSFIAKSDSFATLVQRDGKTAFRIEADSYLAVVSPNFSTAKDRMISFDVSVETRTSLQVTRTGEKIGMCPVVVLDLPPGTKRRYSILFPAVAGSNTGNMWLWVNHGKIEFSDIRIQ